jgi:hypothetical protein
VCCDLLGLSYRTAERRIAAGLFPISELPRRRPKSPHRYIVADIDALIARRLSRKKAA